MTVAELIKQLQQLPPDLLVVEKISNTFDRVEMYEGMDGIHWDWRRVQLRRSTSPLTSGRYYEWTSRDEESPIEAVYL